MLGTARDVDFGVTDETRERATDKGTGVARGGNVGVVQHGVAVATQQAVVTRLGFGEHRDKTIALFGRKLPPRTQPKPSERRSHGLDINRIAHHPMIDGEGTAPSLRHAEHHNLMIHQLDTRRGAGAAGPQ